MRVLTLGRDATNDIQFEDDPHITRSCHCQLIKEDNGSYIITDFSANGTFVNNKQIAKGVPVKLGEYDIVRIGSITPPLRWKDFFTEDKTVFVPEKNNNVNYTTTQPPQSTPSDKENELQEEGEYIVLMYILLVAANVVPLFALAGGVVAQVIGWISRILFFATVIISSKYAFGKIDIGKGEKIKKYDKKTQKHGKIVFWITIGSWILGIIITTVALINY